jgi:pimeloyl-ACP methyl ester carboxylesterase
MRLLFVIIVIILFTLGCGKKKEDAVLKKAETKKIEEKKDTDASKNEGEFTFKSGEITLTARLVKPKGDKVSKLIMIIPDKGPVDMDATTQYEGMVVKPYRDLGDSLKLSNYATLTYNTHSSLLQDKGELYVKLTPKDDLKDIEALLKAVRGRKDLGSYKLYILGHGLGCYMALKFAEGKEEVAGIILFNFNPRTMDKQIMDDIDKKIKDENDLLKQAKNNDQKTLHETNIATLQYNKESVASEFKKLKDLNKNASIYGFCRDWWIEATDLLLNIPNEIKQITAPISVININHDNDVEIKKLIPNATVVTLNNTTSKMLIDNEDSFSKELLKELLQILKE